MDHSRSQRKADFSATGGGRPTPPIPWLPARYAYQQRLTLEEWLMFLGDPKIESMMQQQASRYQ